MLLVVCAAAIIAVSAMAFGGLGKGSASVPTNSGSALDKQNPPPYYILGYVNDSMGVPVADIVVTVTNTRTGMSNTTVTLINGLYMKDVNNELDGGWIPGDIFNVTADDGMYIGWNETAAPGVGEAYTWMDIQLNSVIPEFSTLIVPVVGALAIAVVVGSRRR